MRINPEDFSLNCKTSEANQEFLHFFTNRLKLSTTRTSELNVIRWALGACRNDPDTGAIVYKTES